MMCMNSKLLILYRFYDYMLSNIISFSSVLWYPSNNSNGFHFHDTNFVWYMLDYFVPVLLQYCQDIRQEKNKGQIDISNIEGAEL